MGNKDNKVNLIEEGVWLSLMLSLGTVIGIKSGGNLLSMALGVLIIGLSIASGVMAYIDIMGGREDDDDPSNMTGMGAVV